ncbi:MAG: ribonuclease E/G [Lachnospiraceae bacterium]|nr:ribonuclease E/G [Lachnospiraceae bacterium]
MIRQKEEEKKEKLSEMKTEGMRALAYSVNDAAGIPWTVIYMLEDGRIRRVFTEQTDAPGVGDIYLARVVQISKAISASFVETEGGRFFLPGIYPVGTVLPVMVETLAYREKLAKATTALSVNGSWMVMSLGQPGIRYSRKLTAEQKKRLEKICDTMGIRDLIEEQGVGILFRTKAQEAGEEELKKEAQELAAVLWEIRKRGETESSCMRLYASGSVVAQSLQRIAENGGIWITESAALYERARSEAVRTGTDTALLRWYEDDSVSMAALYGLQAKVKRICSERVWLDCGAELVITEAEAMCVIDVNSAKVRPGKGREETFLKLNLEAAREVMYQVQARNISGTILIDFISMEDKESETILLSEMRSLAKGTYPPIKVVDITKLGIMETTRQRLEGSIKEKTHLLNKTILL